MWWKRHKTFNVNYLCLIDEYGPPLAGAIKLALYDPYYVIVKSFPNCLNYMLRLVCSGRYSRSIFTKTVHSILRNSGGSKHGPHDVHQVDSRRCDVAGSVCLDEPG